MKFSNKRYILAVFFSEVPELIADFIILFSVVHAPKIGDNNVFGVRCQVGPNTTVTRGCFIGTNCMAMLREELPENTVIYGKNNNRRVARDPPQVI